MSGSSFSGVDLTLTKDRFVVTMVLDRSLRSEITFQNVCSNFILPETGKPCLLFCPIQFAQLMIKFTPQAKIH